MSFLVLLFFFSISYLPQPYRSNPSCILHSFDHTHQSANVNLFSQFWQVDTTSTYAGVIYFIKIPFMTGYHPSEHVLFIYPQFTNIFLLAYPICISLVTTVYLLSGKLHFNSLNYCYFSLYPLKLKIDTMYSFHLLKVLNLTLCLHSVNKSDGKGDVIRICYIYDENTF